MIIYKITNKINNKIYIGKTVKTLKRRFDLHKNQSNNHGNTHLYNAMCLYGVKNFSIEQIDTANDISELNKKEMFWIKKYKSYDSNIGYNLTLGGDGGNTWLLNFHKELTSKRLSESIKNSQKHKNTHNTLDYKSKISKLHKGKKLSDNQIEILRTMMINRFKDPKEREKMRLVHKDKPISDEHKRKIGLANKGKILSIETKQKIGMKNKGKRKGKTWEEIFGYDRAQIMRKKRSELSINRHKNSKL